MEPLKKININLTAFLLLLPPVFSLPECRVVACIFGRTEILTSGFVTGGVGKLSVFPENTGVSFASEEQRESVGVCELE